jgi:hypothetical protein
MGAKDIKLSLNNEFLVSLNRATKERKIYCARVFQSASIILSEQGTILLHSAPEKGVE